MRLIEFRTFLGQRLQGRGKSCRPACIRLERIPHGTCKAIPIFAVTFSAQPEALAIQRLKNRDVVCPFADNAKACRFQFPDHFRSSPNCAGADLALNTGIDRLPDSGVGISPRLVWLFFKFGDYRRKGKATPAGRVVGIGKAKLRVYLRPERIEQLT